jgi:4-hydroxy-2-oxovalerate/4-hydroxy-2-oxohexanoate aldolase
MESYGAHTVYVTDSAGYMLPDDVKARVSALRAVLKPETEIGFHGHHNLGMGIANSIAAIEAGATRIDGSAAGWGRGGQHPAGGLCRRVRAHGHRDRGRSLQAHGRGRGDHRADDGTRGARRSGILTLASPSTPPSCCIRSVRPTVSAPARDILVELGRRKMIGGQEDMIMDTAMTMARERGLLKAVAA